MRAITSGGRGDFSLIGFESSASSVESSGSLLFAGGASEAALLGEVGVALLLLLLLLFVAVDFTSLLASTVGI